MRYLGNKTKIMPQIEKLLDEKNILINGLEFCDAFSGTATVGDYFQNVFRIISNDSLCASYYISRTCWRN